MNKIHDRCHLDPRVNKYAPWKTEEHFHSLYIFYEGTLFSLLSQSRRVRLHFSSLAACWIKTPPAAFLSCWWMLWVSKQSGELPGIKSTHCSPPAVTLSSPPHYTSLASWSNLTHGDSWCVLQYPKASFFCFLQPIICLDAILHYLVM